MPTTRSVAMGGCTEILNCVLNPPVRLKCEAPHTYLSLLRLQVAEQSKSTRVDSSAAPLGWSGQGLFCCLVGGSLGGSILGDPPACGCPCGG